MRKRDIKVGMTVVHKTTGRLLGTVSEVKQTFVKYEPGPEGTPYGIAGFTEIDRQ